MKKTNDSLEKIWEFLLQAKNPICCIDSRPDFDAFCSALSLSDILKDAGINLKLTWHSTISDSFTQFIDVSSIEQNVNPNDIDFSLYDALVVLDTGNSTHIAHTNDFELPNNLTIINIDHHASNNLFGDLNYVDSSASSASLLIYRIIKKLSLKPNKNTLKNILLGILTDSGYLQYAATSSEDLRTCADIVDSGVDMFSIIWELLNNQPIDDFKLRKVVYNNLKIDYENKFACSIVTTNEIMSDNINLDNASKPSDMIKRMAGMDFVFTLTEHVDEPGTYDVSFRSHDPNYDVSKLAEALGGGGHKQAAGGIVRNSANITEALQTVINTIENTG